MTLAEIRLIAECDDNAFWIADDERGNIIVHGARSYRISAGSMSMQQADIPDSYVGLFIDGHVLSTTGAGSGTRLILPGGKSVRLPETAAANRLYGSAYDSIGRKLYLLTVNSVVEVSLQSLDVRITEFEDPPDALHAHYERIVSQDGCALAYRYGLAFWSPLGEFRHDERFYSMGTIVGPNKVVVAEERGPIHTYNASGELVHEQPGPPGEIRFLETIGQEPFVVWVEGSSKMRGSATERTVPLGETEVPLFHVWFEDQFSYARMLCSDHKEPTYLGEFGVHPSVVVPEFHCVVFGTMEGVIVVWDVSTGSVETVALPDIDERRNPRIQSLVWCKARQLFFIGTRDGGVYVARLSPSGR